MDIKIFFKFINERNKNNAQYHYECLAAIDEFSPYDMMVVKRDKGNWGKTETTYHEIKSREENVGVNDYETSIIDAGKITTLQRIAVETKSKVFVNVIYPKDRAILIWEINPDTDYFVGDKKILWHSRSEYENRQVYRNKAMAHLQIKEAKRFYY